ncbi:MAG: DNA polymerase III subunit gamma/tau, partial [Chloroflexota bacterium]
MDRDAARGQTQSLYRKYRPETFAPDEFVGQDHIRRTLMNAIAQDRVSHAYLFCGPRGTGKTTTARLLAKAVNCEDPDPAKRPCNACDSCLAISSGRATDIIEIDAASNRGIEDIRDLREQVKYAPTQLRHKFYIIDEAHRLTRDAFNAFLKTLEEPPPNTTFVLATTDPDQLLETVASRCQRFDFRRIPVEEMTARLKYVAEREGIAIDDEAMDVIVRHATGSLRDGLGLLDMLATAVESKDEPIGAEFTRRMLGLSHDERTLALIQALADQDMAAGLTAINQVVEAGQDVRAYGRQVIGVLRTLMLCLAGVDPPEATEELRALAKRFDLPLLLHINRQFSEVDFAIRNGGFPQLPLELAFLGSLIGDPGEEMADHSPPPRTTPRPAPKQRQPESKQPEPAAAQPQPEQRPAEPRPAPASAPEPEDVGDGALQQIVDRWGEIRTEVKAIDRKTEALMASCDPGAIVDGSLVLVAAYPFHAGKLNEDRTKATIEEAVARITGQRMPVVT